MRYFEEINIALSWYQNHVGTYDKAKWEQTVEERILNGITHIPTKRTTLASELIDLDLVQGSSFPKAKAKYGLFTVARHGLARLVLLPFYSSWWSTITSPKLYFIFLFLYVIQFINVVLWLTQPIGISSQQPSNGTTSPHISSSGAGAGDGVEVENESGDPVATAQLLESITVQTSEILSPIVLMIVLTVLHSQIIATQPPLHPTTTGTNTSVVGNNSNKSTSSTSTSSSNKSALKYPGRNSLAGAGGGGGRRRGSNGNAGGVVGGGAAGSAANSQSQQQQPQQQQCSLARNKRNRRYVGRRRSSATAAAYNNASNSPQRVPPLASCMATTSCCGGAAGRSGGHEGTQSVQFNSSSNSCIGLRRRRQGGRVLELNGDESPAEGRENNNVGVVGGGRRGILESTSSSAPSTGAERNVLVNVIGTSKSNNNNCSSSNCCSSILSYGSSLKGSNNNNNNSSACGGGSGTSVGIVKKVLFEDESKFMFSSNSDKDEGIAEEMTTRTEKELYDEDEDEHLVHHFSLPVHDPIIKKHIAETLSTFERDEAVSMSKLHHSPSPPPPPTRLLQPPPPPSSTSFTPSTTSTPNSSPSKIASTCNVGSTCKGICTCNSSGEGGGVGGVGRPSCSLVNCDTSVTATACLIIVNGEGGCDTTAATRASSSDKGLVNDKGNTTTTTTAGLLKGSFASSSSSSPSLTLLSSTNAGAVASTSSPLSCDASLPLPNNSSVSSHVVVIPPRNSPTRKQSEETSLSAEEDYERRRSSRRSNNNRAGDDGGDGEDEDEDGNTSTDDEEDATPLKEASSKKAKKQQAAGGKGDDEDEDEEEENCDLHGSQVDDDEIRSKSEWTAVTTNSEDEDYVAEEDNDNDIDSEAHPDAFFENHPFAWEFQQQHGKQPFSPSCTSSDKVSCTIWEEQEAKKADLTVLDISATIIARVERARENSDYLYLGMCVSFLLASLPCLWRLNVDFEMIDDFHVTKLGDYFWNTIELTCGVTLRARLMICISSLERLCLSFFVFFLLAVAEKTYKQRFLYSKLFSRITSTRKAKKSGIPHFRLNKVRNIKTWLSVRSYLQKRGPQRSVNIIVSSTFISAIILIFFLSVELLKDSSRMYYLYNIEVLVWSLCLGVYLLRFMTLGSRISQKYRNLSVIITEQLNLYLKMEQKPHKKDELMVANNVLKLAAELLKELDDPFKISSFATNPYLYNLTRLVILSAFSGVLSEMLGFKLKLYKIKMK